ncbi:MAG TPA: P1 family peptidase [Trebonia sp.]|nr:P1 family peptidase [Trebonia sp.]
MEQRPARARDLGIVVGGFEVGAHNAITDVPSVAVGHATIVRGADIRTGVTAVVPAGVLAADGRLPAALAVGNGYGKFIGATQVAELGVIETPVVLTATLSAFRAADALAGYVLALPGWESVTSVNPVVGETNDGFLSDIRDRPVTEDHVRAALTSAAGGPVAEGAVGAGTGTGALGFKAGIGTSSRVVGVGARAGRQAVRVGVLVQANFSGTLTVLGVPIPKESALAGLAPDTGAGDSQYGNSCVIVVATDVAVDARQLARIARRALAGLVRTGSDLAGGSGDYALAFSTASPGGAVVPDGALDPVFAATADCVEEAILNSLFMARTTTGMGGHTRYAVPHDRVRDALAAAGRPLRLSAGPQGIVTVTGGEAIPLATTTSVLLPAGVCGGRVNRVADQAPGATETEVQSLVRA